MKVYRNKTLQEIHWSTYLAAFLCFFATYSIYGDYTETKYLFEKGIVEKAVVVKVPENCSSSTRGKKYCDVSIISTGRIADISIDKKMCDTIMLNDTLLIRTGDKLDKILRYNPAVTNTPKADLYFSVFPLCLGIVFLIFGNEKNNFLFGDKLNSTSK